MFPGFMQTAILTVIVILAQTTKHIHSSVSLFDIDENPVLSLTQDTFDDAVKNNKYLLVKFIAPWCGHCKSLQPVYEAAAKRLAASGSEVKLASVDATIEKELAQKFEVKGYPTLKFFNEGETNDYTGGRSEDEIVNWLNKRTGPPAEEFTTIGDLETFKELHDVVVIGAFQNPVGDAITAFLQVAKNVDSVPFGITTNKNVLKQLNVQEDTVIVFKKFDEGRNDLTSTLDETSIREFIQTNQLPLIIEFNAQTAQKIFNIDIKIHVLLFSSIEDDNYEKNLEEFETTAKNFRGKTVFVTVDPDDGDNQRIIEYFGLQKSHLPAVRLISLHGKMDKYKPDSTEITSSVLIKFVTDFFEGQTKPNLLSQDIPENWNLTPVKILVGKNFYDVANDTTKTVLVAFIAPWCGHCKQLTPIYEELGEKYKDSEDVIIAKMDSTANEVQDIKIESFPTIKLFLKDSNEVVDYFGERTVEGFSKFIDSNGEDNGKPEPAAEEPKEHVEEAKEEEEDSLHEDL